MRYNWKGWKWFVPNKKLKELTQQIQSRKLKNDNDNKKRERRTYERKIIDITDCQTISTKNFTNWKREWNIQEIAGQKKRITADCFKKLRIAVSPKTTNWKKSYKI